MAVYTEISDGELRRFPRQSTALTLRLQQLLGLPAAPEDRISSS